MIAEAASLFVGRCLCVDAESCRTRKPSSRLITAGVGDPRSTALRGLGVKPPYGWPGDSRPKPTADLTGVGEGFRCPRCLRPSSAFQHRHGLHRTGSVGYPTWKALGVRPSSASRATSRSHGSTATSRDAVVLRIAALQQGKRYRYGATGPSSFDCSGFVGYVYRKAGVNLPRTSGAIRNKVRGAVSHVAIVAGNGNWYEAANPSKPVGKHKAWTRSVSYGRI